MNTQRVSNIRVEKIQPECPQHTGATHQWLEHEGDFGDFWSKGPFVPKEVTSTSNGTELFLVHYRAIFGTHGTGNSHQVFLRELFWDHVDPE